MTNLPPLPKDRDYSEATWRAGLDEAVRLNSSTAMETWGLYCGNYNESAQAATIAHATTLLDAGIVKPVVSEAVMLFCDAIRISKHGHPIPECLDSNDLAAIAVIQSALDKARNGE